jgi:hypothetical protein
MPIGKPPVGPQVGGVAPWSSPDAREPEDFTNAFIAGIGSADTAIEQMHEIITLLNRAGFVIAGPSVRAAIQRYHDLASDLERAVHEIAHLPDDADLHEATSIALRALPLLEDKPVFERCWCAWCGGTCECDGEEPDDLSDGLPHLNRNE